MLLTFATLGHLSGHDLDQTLVQLAAEHSQYMKEFLFILSFLSRRGPIQQTKHLYFNMSCPAKTFVLIVKKRDLKTNHIGSLVLDAERRHNGIICLFYGTSHLYSERPTL